MGWEKRLLQSNWGLHQPPSGGVRLCSRRAAPAAMNCADPSNTTSLHPSSKVTVASSALPPVCAWLQVGGFRTSHRRSGSRTITNIQALRGAKFSLFQMKKSPIVDVWALAYQPTPHPYTSQSPWPNTRQWTCVSSEVRATWPRASKPTSILPAGKQQHF